MKMKRIMLATAALWAIAHTVACAETIQIGDGTSNTAYVPTYGWFDYSWSDSIYLKEEIGDTCVITGLSYYVTNEPYEYTMSNQRIFLLETNRASFDAAAYEDPAVSGAAAVFDGTVTWNGSGWHSIPFDTPFDFSGEANLVIHWENRDGSWGYGYPRFAYTTRSARAMYNNSDGSFPTGGWPSIVNTLPNVILHCSSIGGGMATLPQPPDAAPAVPRDAQPTLAWSNPRKALCNAVYFSKIRNDIAATNPAARVLYDGSTVFSNYTHGAALDPGTTYYWGVLEDLERGPMFNEPFSFTTEPLPQATFPWTTGFENGGAMPPYWHEDFLSGSTPWTVLDGGPSGQPASASRGTFNACFAGPAGARTRLVAPVIDLGGATAPVLTFMIAQPLSDTSADALRIHYRTSPTNEWTLAPGGEFTAPLANWTRRSLALPSPSSTYYLAFEGVGAGGGGVCLDDVAVLTEHGAVTLQVFDSYGDPLAAAPCALFAPAGDNVAFDAGATDADGLFSVPGVPAGDVGFVVDEAFHNPFEGVIALAPGGCATQRIDLAAATHLAGVVREGTEQGPRIEGAAVDLRTPEPESALVASATTDAFGQYRLERIPEGAYRLAAAHPGYAPAATDLVVNASASHVLALQPRAPKSFDVYVQVNCAMSGLPIPGAGVAIEVRESSGLLLYGETLVSDDSGNLCFRGVPAGTATFVCNGEGGERHPWWESFTSPPQYVANAKLVNIRLKPMKSSTTVDLDFAPTDGYGDPIPVAPFVQNFWIEAVGINPDTGASLYPPRTELTDHEGRATFEHLPAMPTRFTVRRPGFENVATTVWPDANAAFPALVPMQRPPITANTTWDLTLNQDLLAWLPPGESSSPYLRVEGLPGGNSEGYDDDYRHHLVGNHANPFPVLTAHGQMSAWGQSRFQVTPGYEGYIMSPQGGEGFMFGLDFPPQILPIAEGAANSHTIQATYRPASVWGTLFAADEVNEEGLTVYRPAAGREVVFRLHESVKHLFQPGYEIRTATTDTNGFYSLTLPPGIYGIEIPQMNGYWGRKVDIESVAGWGGMDGGWPYAYTNAWRSYANSTDVFDGNGIPVNSGAQFKLDLYVNRNRYVVRSVVGETSPVRDRLIYRSADDSIREVEPVKDLLETETVLRLSNNAEARVRQTANGAMHAVWTNLAAGTFTLAGDDHDYLSSSTVVSRAAFAWGDHPGQPPATEPPYAGGLTQTPLPMQLFTLPQAWYECDTSITDPPPVTVSYAVWNGEGYDVQTTDVSPSYVEYQDLPGRIYLANTVDRSRVLKYYVPFVLSGGDHNVYAVPGSGPFAVDTMGGTPPVQIPLPPFDMTVVARSSDNPAEVIDDLPFLYNYEAGHRTPASFTGLTYTPAITWDDDVPAPWQKGTIAEVISPTSTPVKVETTIFCRPRLTVQGGVVNASSGLPVANAVASLFQADGLSSTPLNYKTTANGQFTFNNINTMKAHLLKIEAPGYLPYRRRFVLGDLIVATNSTAFVAALGSAQLAPATSVVQNIAWNRGGAVLHGVEAAGPGEGEDTADALALTVGADLAIPAQTYAIEGYDNEPAGLQTHAWDDAFTELWVVDARRPDAQGDYIAYEPATPADYYPLNAAFMPPPSDPDKIRAWLQKLDDDGQVVVKSRVAAPAAAVSATGSVSVATLRPGDIVPLVVGVTRQGAYALAVPEGAAINSVALPHWLAFAADTLAAAASLQSQAADLKATYASKVPDGKLAALPSLSGGIEEQDGCLTYGYGLGVQWEEGSDAPGGGGLAVGPGLLGLQFEAEAKIGFDGSQSAVSFEIAGVVGKEDVDINDYAPAFIGNLGIEGEITSIGGRASTTKSAMLAGDHWKDLELTTDLGANFDFVLRYNLSTITGKLPYVGPFIVAADKANALRMFGRLDAGGRVQATSTWRTLEPGRAAEVGDPFPEPYATRSITARADDRELTPSRHCLGGQENSSEAWSGEFKLGLHFGAGFEGTALGDHLNVHAGLEITGGENDLVAGQPSLVITPNKLGDWPPIQRVQGDVNAFIRAKLDVYVTEIEKDWTINLARIDHQFTTESLLTMADLAVSIVERPVSSTEFTGVLPTLVRNLPRGSTFAQAGGRIVFGMYDAVSERTDLVVCLANETGYGEPTTIVEGVEGLGRILLAEIGEDAFLLVWEERPGVVANPAARSVLRAARCTAGTWQPPQTVLALNGYLRDMAVFSSTATNSLVFAQSPSPDDDPATAIHAVGYDAAADVWDAVRTVQTLADRRDLAMASAGWTSPEPGRLVTLSEAGGVDSLYWDGARASVSGGVASVRISAATADAVALCAAGTNETLYATWVDGDGALKLNRYDPDPLRNPLDPDYDWNGRDAAQMWPAVTNLATIDGVVVDVANAWLEDNGPLLSVIAILGNLHANVFDTAGASGVSNFVIAASPGGRYDEIAIEPLSNGLARVAACHTSRETRELRVFVVEAAPGVPDEDCDGDGIPDRLEIALVDADPDDELNDIRDIEGTHDFDGDGFDNATEWAHGTLADNGSSYPRLGVSVDAVSPLAREDGLLPGRFLVSRADGDDADGDLTVFYAIGGTAVEGDDYEPINRSVVIDSGRRAAVVTIQPLADTDVEGLEDVLLALLPDAGYALAVDTQAVVKIRDASRDAWRGENFTPQELVDPDISGDAADPDGDGIPNALEHAMRLDPWLPDPTEIGFRIEDGTAFLGYAWDPAVEDMEIEIVRSLDLAAGDWAPLEGDLTLREARADQLEDVGYESPATPTNAFFRLRGRRLDP